MLLVCGRASAYVLTSDPTPLLGGSHTMEVCTAATRATCWQLSQKVVGSLASVLEKGGVVGRPVINQGVL